MQNAIPCTQCKAAIGAEQFEPGLLSACPFCAAELALYVFPALSRGIVKGSAGELIVAAGEASCYYHPEKKAAVNCNYCGRFICGLCDMELSNEHLCPACLEAGQRKGRLSTLENRRVVYSNISLALAILPMLLWPITIATGPAAIYLALRHWKDPGSLVASRAKTRAILIAAIVLGLLQVVVWLFVLGAMIFNDA